MFSYPANKLFVFNLQIKNTERYTPCFFRSASLLLQILCNFHYGIVYITWCLLFCFLDLFNYISSYILCELLKLLEMKPSAICGNFHSTWQTLSIHQGIAQRLQGAVTMMNVTQSLFLTLNSPWRTTLRWQRRISLLEDQICIILFCRETLTWRPTTSREDHERAQVSLSLC